ncbi:hypothetical protein SpCBS45565_g02990 [Spizellomyces sp. 'palustris']|nr:hypothetical protein SpCBS45565_g02990 [Spizellomyces sp. 'palustris']
MTSISTHATSLAAVAATRETPHSTYPNVYVFPKDKLKSGMERCPGVIPLVIVACGSYSPVTNLHLRMFEMARDYVNDHPQFCLLGGYFSPVSDAYNKPGLAAWNHRVRMCELAVADSDWLMVDPWESRQPEYQRTAWVLDHFDRMLNEQSMISEGTHRRIHIMLLAGGDLIQSFAVPNLWKESDLDHILGDFGCLIIERSGADLTEFMLQSDVLYRHRVRLPFVPGFMD